MAIRFRTVMSRRRLVTGAATYAAAAAVGGIAKPYLSRAADRPPITHGIQSGDIAGDSGVVWARTDRPARMLVEASTTESFAAIQNVVAIDVLPETDFTGKVLLENLPRGQDVFYRIRFEDLAAPTIVGPEQIGRFRTAPADRRGVTFVWSGDTAGRGWGIDESRGGMRTYAAMLRNRPDFFIHSGDTNYPTVRSPAGRSFPTAKSGGTSSPRRSLTSRRHSTTTAATTGTICSTPTFGGSTPKSRSLRNGTITRSPTTGGPGRSGTGHRTSARRCLRRAGAAPSANTCRSARRWRRPGAFTGRYPYGPLLDLFMLDMRSYRGPNDRRNDPSRANGRFLGAVQVEWLKTSLAASNATWKVICADLPIGLISDDAVAQADGAPAGREFEIADLLAFIKHAGVHNTVWITAGMHRSALL
jgi:alkaline phosphatase D